MRNFIFLLCLTIGLLVFSNHIFAFDDNSSKKKKKNQIENKLTYGISLSPTISWLDIDHDDLQTDGASLNAAVGFLVEYYVFKVISILNGVNFQLNGGYAFDSLSLSDISTKNNFRMTYSVIDVPLILRIKTLPVNNNIYYVQAGVSGGFKAFANEYHKAATKNDYPIKTDIKNLINEIQFNSLFGIGTKFLVNKHLEFFTEVNYRSSLTEVASIQGYTKANKYSPNAVPHIRSGNLIFSVGIQF